MIGRERSEARHKIKGARRAGQPDCDERRGLRDKRRGEREVVDGGAAGWVLHLLAGSQLKCYAYRQMDIIRIIFAIILPPVGVFLQVGIGKHFWINILLTLLGYIPGIVHAVYIIAKVGPKSPR